MYIGRAFWGKSLETVAVQVQTTGPGRGLSMAMLRCKHSGFPQMGTLEGTGPGDPHSRLDLAG